MSNFLQDRRLAVSIEFPIFVGSDRPVGAVNPKIWFGSHSDISYPPGVTPLRARLLVDEGISPFSWDADFFNSTYSISNMTVRVVDKDGSLSDEISQKLVDLVGTRHAIVRVFELYAGQSVIDVGPLMNRFDSFNSNVAATYFMMNHSFDRGMITIECKDIIRQMKDVLFENKDLVLTIPFRDGDENLNVINPDLDDSVVGVETCNFEHNERYSLHPGNTNQPSNVAYVRLRDSGEIIAVEPQPANFPNILPIVERGLFNTISAAIPLEQQDDPRNGPQVENVVYIEEFAPEMLYMLLTGRSNSGPNPRILPDNYHLNINPMWVNEYSMFGDNSNNGTADNLRLRILRTEPVNNAKKWIEKQILFPMRSVLHINRFGQIELVKAQAVSEGSEQLVLDMRNIKSISPLYHVKENIYNPIILEYDRSILDGKYKRVHGFDDAASTFTNQNTESKRFQLETLYSAINSASQIDKIRISLQDFYAHEHQTLSLGVVPSVYRQHSQIGHRVRVKLPKMRDDAQIEGNVAEDIDRVFMIRGVKRNIMNCDFSLELISTQRRATDFPRVLSEYEIPDEKYPVDKIDLRSVIGNQISSSVSPNGDIQYFMNSVVTIPGGRYWFDGNLTINGTIFSILLQGGTGDIELWVLGRLDINGTIDTVGQGAHRPGTGEQVIGLIAGGRWVDEIKELSMVAEGAYFGTPNTVGGILKYQSGSSMTAIPPLDEITGEVEEVPELHLSNECGCLRGIPPTVSGTPSSGSMGSVDYFRNPFGTGFTDAVTTPGLDGARGGGGVVLVSRGGSFGPSGKIITNGEAAATPTVVNQAAHNLVSPRVPQFSSNAVQVNSGGMPGAFIWLTDGGIHTAPFDDNTIINHFDAFAGDSRTAPFTVMPEESFRYRTNASPDYYSYYAPTDHTINRAIAASRHQYVPQNQKLQESQDSHWLDDEAALNADNQVVLWSPKDGPAFNQLGPDGLPPVPNPNSRDLYIDLANLNSGLPQDQIIMWRFNAGIWEMIVGFDSTASFLLDICRRFMSSTLHFGSTRPTSYEICDAWFNEDTDKTLKLGATPADDSIIYTRQYGDLGDDVLEDGNFLYHDTCEITWQTDTNRFSGPNIFPGSFPKYPEQIVGGSTFGSTIGENATPGWQLDAQGLGNYICLRPRRPIKIHPGEKYVVESIIRTTGFSIVNPAAEGYTVFSTVFDEDGNLIWNNGTDTALGQEHFQGSQTLNLTASGWHLVHAVFTIPETLTDARYLVPNAMVHAGIGSVLISQMHVRRLREQHTRDVTPAPFTLGLGQFGQPSNFPTNSQFDMEIPQGSRFNFSITGVGVPSNDCQYFLNLRMMRNGAPIKSYFWDHWFEAGTRQSLDIDFDYIAEQYYDGFRFEFGFAGTLNPFSMNVVEDFVWAFKQFTQIESGAID